MIRDREVSATEVMTAFLSQIQRVNPSVNALCTFVGEEAALRSAKEADEHLAKGQIKLSDTSTHAEGGSNSGLRGTYGRTKISERNE